LRTSLFRAIGGFDEEFEAAEDYDLWLRILANYEAGLIDEFLVTRRAGHPGQLSATVPAIDRFRILTLLKLLARNDGLSADRRAAVCEVLAEKSRILAKGLWRRGQDDLARRLAALSARAHNWIVRVDGQLHHELASLRPILMVKHRNPNGSVSPTAAFQ
jgi:hypothetical protein